MVLTLSSRLELVRERLGVLPCMPSMCRDSEKTLEWELCRDVVRPGRSTSSFSKSCFPLSRSDAEDVCADDVGSAMVATV